MLPVPQPTLFEGPFCAPCPLPCAERNTDAACDHTGPAILDVHPGVPDVFEQWVAWSAKPAAPSRAPELPPLPAYMAIIPREAVPAAVPVTTGPLVFTLRDFFAVAGRAEHRGISVRELLGARGRRIVVLGAEPDPFVLRCWQRWPEVRDRLVRHAPDLIIGPDLGFYANDQPASRILSANAHTVMYRDVVERGIAALPPIGWTRMTDIDRFAAWCSEFEVPGAFLDLQRRTAPSAFDAVVDDLRSFRDRFAPGFFWIVNGVQIRERWEVLQAALGTVRFTSSGAWHYARNGYVLDPDHGPIPSPLARLDAFEQSVLGLSRAASEVVRGSRQRVHVLRVRQLELFETRDAGGR